MKPLKKTLTQRGRWAEDLVARQWVHRGFKLYQKNYRHPLAEVDLLFFKAPDWWVVEVKSAPRERDTSSLVGRRQIQRLKNFCLSWQSQHPQYQVRSCLAVVDEFDQILMIEDWLVSV